VLIAASVCVALLIAGGFFTYRLSAVRQSDESRHQAAVAELKAQAASMHARSARNDAVTTAPESVSESADANTYEDASELLDVPVASLPEPGEPVYVTALPDTTRAGVVVERRELVVAHLEFGEFERAVQAARGADDAEERSALLSLVADAQMKIGDLGAALGSIRTMPGYNERRIARDRHSQQLALAGGQGANFQPLIDLIMQETDGLWEDIDGSGGTISEFEQGVRVDPTGVLKQLTQEEQSERLKDVGVRVRNALLNDELAQVSDLRVISLPRLERAVAQRLSEGREPTRSQKLLGGLTSIKHVFVYPEDGEIVIAGPAEAWKYNSDGLPVGVESGRPILQLDDLVVILRTFSATDQRFFSCSINPRPDGLKRLKSFVESTSSSPLRPGAGVRNWVSQLQTELGRQDIVFKGIDPESRVARIIVEADYRMKMIGIGKYDFENGSRIPSIFDLMTPEERRSSKLDALRWWLTMQYDSVLHTPDRDGYEFVGSSVLCLSENQFLNAQGQQVLTGKSEGSNRVFAETFTAHYEQLAAQDLVFGDLRNVFDLALVAAIVHNEGAARRTGWDDYGVFSNAGSYLTQRHDAPLEVDSVVNHRVFGGRDIVVQVAGGVRADLSRVFANAKVFREGQRMESTVDSARSSDDVAPRSWWWDAR
jgi:hypothetical protein